MPPYSLRQEAQVERPNGGPPSPPHASEVDALEELGEAIAVLAAHIHAATARFLTLVAEFDRRRGWEVAGHRSCAHWLAARVGIDLGTAREKVRAARRLEELPKTRAAMARGELSFSQVRALTRVATPENEVTLLELGRGLATHRLEQMVRGWKMGSRETEAEREQARLDSRCFSLAPDASGMYVVRGRLPPELGILVMRAIEAAGDVLFREEHRKGERKDTGQRRDGPTPGENTAAAVDPEAAVRDAARRRADALGVLAEIALARGLGQESSECTCREGRVGEGHESPGVQTGRAGRCSCVFPLPLSGSGAERYQVVLHVDEGTLLGEEDEAEANRGTGASPGADTGPVVASAYGRSEFSDGTRVSPETSRRISCDSGLIPMIHGVDGGIIGVGRKRRTVSPALRRALEARDRGCRFPGCGSRYTDAHHVRHWAEGGPTDLDNCLLLCRHHHRLVHEGGWTIQWWGKGRPAFVDPRGQTHVHTGWIPGTPLPDPQEDASPSRVRIPDPDPVEELMAANRRAGTEADGWTPTPQWPREEDVPDEIHLPALEAIGEALS